MTYDVTVIGGGPSGLMAAISAAENGANTLLIEKGTKLGNKLAISGGGRCNVTNRLPQDEIIEHIPGNGKFLYSAFSVFNNYDIIEYFEGLGIALKEEDHGRMFPKSNSAKSVVDTLINRLNELGATIQLSTAVEALDYGEEVHTIILKDGKSVQTKSVVIAVGGKSVPHTGSTGDGYPWAKKAGHTVTTLYPTEVPLTSKETFIKNKTLQGLSLRDVALSVLDNDGKPIISHQMDMIFTHFGISGPATLRCSQFVVKELMKGREEVPLAIDLMPSEHEDALRKRLQKVMIDQPKKAVKNILKTETPIPERLIHFLLTNITNDEHIKAAHFSNEKMHQLVQQMKRFTFQVHGSLSIEKAFVTGGGVAINEVIPNTMESKFVEKVFFCGEILDIHGYTGGYNITVALVTGRLAGTNAAYMSFT